MFETISVDEAIKKGQLNVNLPVRIIQYTLFLLCFLLIKYTSTPGWIILTVVILSFVLPWLYWSFAITRWRLWAFKNVNDVYRLERTAVEKKLIWPRGHFFEKTEIRTTEQQRQWAKTSERFEKEEPFE